MTTKTTDDLAARIAKLPGWAREHIDQITRERDRAVDRLQKYLDDQTATSFYTEDPAPVGSRILRRYIDAWAVTCTRGKLRVEISPRGSKEGITVRFDLDRGMSLGRAVIIPESSNSIRIVEVPKET